MTSRKRLTLGQKAVLAILALGFVLTITAVLVSYRVYSFTADNHYRALSGNVAATAASVVDGDQVRKYTDAVKEIYLKNPAPQFTDEQEKQDYFLQYRHLMDEDYRELFYTLERIKSANRVLSLYIVYMDDASKTCVYIVDGDSSADACPIGTWDVIYEQNYKAMKTPEKGFPAYITNTAEFGWLSSAGAAVLGEDGKAVAHVMVDISMNDVIQDKLAYLLQLCLILLMTTIILIFLFIGAVHHAVVKPINTLALAAGAFVQHKEKMVDKGESVIQQLEIHTGDEVENLFHSIKQMEQDINCYIENLTAVTAEKERIETELSVAAQIQASMLPNRFPAFPQRSEFDIYATMTPAKEVGGDFYDFFLVDDDHLAVVIADVSGKGVPAALFMVIAKTLIKDHTQAGNSPEAVFTAVNRKLCESNERGMFVTAWMGVMQISTGQLRFVNAGHNPPLIRHGTNRWEYLKIRTGFVLAGIEDLRYQLGEIQLASGDGIYLYTDGVTEATNAADELFGEERLKAVLDRERGDTPESVLKAVEAELHIFVGEAPQFDDITMLGLRRKEVDNQKWKELQ